MSDEKPVDLKKLAEEAAREGRASVRSSKWCRLWHDWTRWQPDATRRVQHRWCIGCGRVQRHVLVKTCEHIWMTTKNVDIYQTLASGERSKLPVRFECQQICTTCGDVRSKTL